MLLSSFSDSLNHFVASSSLQDINISNVRQDFLRGGAILSRRDIGGSESMELEDISFLSRRQAVFGDHELDLQI